MAMIFRPLTASLLLLSLLVIATANDYSYDSSNTNTQPYNYGRKAAGGGGDQNPDYSTNPTTTPKQEENKPDQSNGATQPDSYKPQPVESEKPVYQPQPEKPESEKPDNYGSKEKAESEQEKKPDYGTNQDSYKPQPKPVYQPQRDKEDQKPDAYGSNAKPGSEEEEKPDYSTKPDTYYPKPQENGDYHSSELPDLFQAVSETLPIGVEGLVLCKSGSKYNPIKGALVRIACQGVDNNGYEKPHSACSAETDEKGYFLETLSPFGLVDNLLKLTECKAFLESSPLQNCNVPVDVNGGVTGALLSNFRILSQRKIKLFSVGPFFFTSNDDNKSAAPTNTSNNNGNY